MPSNVEIIPSAFIQESKLTTLEIPESAKIIDESSLGCNYYLNNVIFHEGLEEIRRSAFLLCDDLKTFMLPSTIKFVGQFALAEASTFFCKATTPPSCEGNIGRYKPTVYVPIGTKALYAEAEGWKNAKEIIELTAEEFEMAGIGDVTVTEYSVTVIASNGQAIIETSADSPTGFAIYSTDGRLVTSGIAAPRTAVSLAPGIYIVRTADSTTKIAL